MYSAGIESVPAIPNAWLNLTSALNSHSLRDFLKPAFKPASANPKDISLFGNMYSADDW